MAAPLRTRRMARERVNLEKRNGDYFVLFNDENLLKFDAYVIGPSDTLYAYKLVKLRFEIPERYPLEPPKCTFIQHSPGRIHPNLYDKGGKVCLSILGTWPGEPWALAMTIETVLITVRSLLDNEPFRHEPGCTNDHGFNDYVQYYTWKCLLLDYIRNEQDPAARTFLQNHVCENGANMIAELKRQENVNKNVKQFPAKYGSKSAIVDYQALLNDIERAVKECTEAVETRKASVEIAASNCVQEDGVEVTNQSQLFLDNNIQGKQEEHKQEIEIIDLT